MAALDGKVVVVAGGTGSLGEGLCRQFVEQGAQVCVPYRSEEKAERLRSYIRERGGNDREQLHLFPAHIGEEQSVQHCRNQVLEKFEHVHMAVACLGNWYYGYSLHRMPVDHFERVIQNNLMTHFLFMRAFLSHMHEVNDGVYVMVNGGVSEIAAPDAGAISIAAAAQRMMTQVLADEAKGKDIRVHSVVAFHPVKTRERSQQVMEEWLTPEEIGDYIVRLYNRSVPKAAEVVHTLYTNRDL